MLELKNAVKTYKSLSGKKQRLSTDKYCKTQHKIQIESEIA
jgi:hypothetical protein